MRRFRQAVPHPPRASRAGFIALAALGLVLGTALPSWAQMGGPGGGMRPIGGGAPPAAGEEKEQNAEAAPQEASQEPALQPLPAWPGQKEKTLQFFQLSGYMRGRAYLFHNFQMGASFNQATSASVDPPFFIPYSDYNATGVSAAPGVLSSAAARTGGEGKADNITSADMRMRLEPTINVTEQVRIKAQFDIFDNMVLGTTPDGFFMNGLRSTGDIPVIFASRGQAPAELGVNSLQSAIRVKRAWAEVRIPIGEIHFGRMPSHWGSGMFINNGSCLDCDYGINTDRIMFTTKLWNHFFAFMWDWAATGPTTRIYMPNVQTGPQYNADPVDDVSQWAIALGRQDKPEDIKEKLAKGNVVVNYGGFFAARWQDWDFKTDKNSTGNVLPTDYLPDAAGVAPSQAKVAETLQTRMTPRKAWSFVPDLWLKLLYKKFSLETEVVVVTGQLTVEANSPLKNVPDPSMLILQFGGMGRLGYRFLRDQLNVTLEVGFASGDSAEDPRGRINFRTAQPYRLKEQNRITNFMFDPDYHVDMILWRRIVGTVTNATYIKPAVTYDVLDNLQIGGAVIYSLANTPVGWPGNDINLGLELDANIMYHNDEEGFYAGIGYGVLFPFAGLSYPASIYGEGAFSAGTAQTFQGRIAVKF